MSGTDRQTSRRVPGHRVAWLEAVSGFGDFLDTGKLSHDRQLTQAGGQPELPECLGPGTSSLPFRLQRPPSGRQIRAATVLEAAAAGHSLSCLRSSPALTAPDPGRAPIPQGGPEPQLFLGPLYRSCALDSQVLPEGPGTFRSRCTPSFRHFLSPSFS